MPVHSKFSQAGNTHQAACKNFYHKYRQEQRPDALGVVRLSENFEYTHNACFETYFRKAWCRTLVLRQPNIPGYPRIYTLSRLLPDNISNTIYILCKGA
jgi:hypothetical protein